MNEDVRITDLPALTHTKLHIGHSFVWTHIFPESTQVPRTRSKHATCHHNGSIYLYGGVCGNVSLKDMWRFEPSTSLWTKLECCGDTPPLLQDHTMVGYKESIFIFGGLCGFDNPGETSLWILDLTKFTWRKQVITSEVTTPTSRRGHSVVCHNGGMHLFGGHLDLKGSCNEMWTLDFDSLYWHTMVYSSQDSCPPPRHGHSAVIHDNSMFIYGGSKNLQPLQDMWKWDFGSGHWSKVRYWQGPPALHGHSALCLGDSMLIYGGEDKDGVLRSDLWIFSFSSESWTKVPYKGSIVPSPTMHQTFEMDIPQSNSLFPPQDERSLSAPFLQRPSMSSLHVRPHPRPHSSPAYSKGSMKERAFRNRVHPNNGHVASSDVGDSRDTVSAMSRNADDDVRGDDSSPEDGVDGEEDIYNSRIFIPVDELTSSSRENLLEDLASQRSDTSTRTFRKRRVRPVGTDALAALDGEGNLEATSGDVLLTDLDLVNHNKIIASPGTAPSIPRVSIEDYDKPENPKTLINRSHGFGNGISVGNTRCNNLEKFNKRPQIIQVMPKSKSDEIPLLSCSIDDMNLKNKWQSCEQFAFVNDGFTIGDDTLKPRQRSNSLTEQKLVIESMLGERHLSLNDLPNMATLIMRQHDRTSTNRTQRYHKEPTKPSGKRPVLKKRSQTDHTLYAKTIQQSNEQFTADGFSSKGRHHVPVPVHLYVFGGQEPNVSSVHKYQTRLPVFRCTIVPGKLSPNEIQALLH
ncbi:uncharacterized protein LOC121426186 [Lytechinus variegatus]|uniref:uncharacterized protein LOC121426186 n=1 Tax=Lytechinus variegatus TaxID=7654 RepID=UPI001BB1B943|nr:uncharacterized protein LOC121426186 [Lytechinus variegatus]